jgi:hypothetical protein
MKSILGFVLAAAVMAAGFAATARAEARLASMPEKRHIAFLADEAAARMGGTAGEEVRAVAERWDSLDLKNRTWLEKLLVTLRNLTRGQTAKIFGHIERMAKDKRRAAVKKAFDDLVSGASIPAVDKENPAVCVVIVGAGVKAKYGFGDSELRNFYRIGREIIPYGTFLKGLSSPWAGNLTMRPQWIGELLTGRKMGGVQADAGVWKFMRPTLLHFFRKNALCPEGKAWMISAGDQQKIIYDHLPLQEDWSERYRPIALTSIHLNRYDEAVRDHFLSEIRSDKSPIRVQAGLYRTLTPGKLRLSTDFNDLEAQNLIKNVIAGHGGNTCDNNAFVTEMAVQLFRSDLNPELVVVRLAPDWRLSVERRARVVAELMAKKARDDDETAYSIWTAFRGNPYLRRKGYFIILCEGHPGALVVGPDVPPGVVLGARFKLEQMVSTIAHMLHFDFVKFGQPYIARAHQPIRDLFDEEKKKK